MSFLNLNKHPIAKIIINKHKQGNTITIKLDGTERIIKPEDNIKIQSQYLIFEYRKGYVEIFNLNQIKSSEIWYNKIKEE